MSDQTGQTTHLQKQTRQIHSLRQPFSSVFSRPTPCTKAFHQSVLYYKTEQCQKNQQISKRQPTELDT